MDQDSVIFWTICLTCLSGLVAILFNFRLTRPGWIILYLSILFLCVTGRLIQQQALIYLSGGMMLLFIFLPALLSRWYYRFLLQERHSTARWMARVMSWVHPADGWREQPDIVHAIEMARGGDMSLIAALLKRHEQSESAISLSVVPGLYRILNRWEDLVAWERQHSEQLARNPQLLPALLRARGEMGDLHGLVELYEQHKNSIRKLHPPAARDLCRLMLFAFNGKRDLVDQLFNTTLALLPADAKQFWLATVDLADGNTKTARNQLELLIPDADPLFRTAIERRLAQLSAPPTPVLPNFASTIDNAALEQLHEQRLAPRSQLASRMALITQLLILLNLLMFSIEVLAGGASNLETLFRLGALYAPAVLAGQWWRLISSIFLHFGILHLAMNMFALWLLGPSVEAALGALKFLLLYLLTGIGSMAFVMFFSSGPGQQLTVGASGCVMGLIGATAAIMLRVWARQKAHLAKRRLISMLAIVVMQTIFDSLVPHVSMAAHLSGAALGFGITFLLRDRLQANSSGSRSRAS